MVRYTLLRFLVFFGCLALLWLAGLRAHDQRPWLIVGAAVLSTVISYFALRPFREQTIENLSRHAQARAERHGATDEDIEDGLRHDSDADFR